MAEPKPGGVAPEGDGARPNPRPNPTRRGRFSGLSRDTWLLALASLFADVSTEMLYPVLPVFLTQSLHASGAAVGLIEGIATGVQNIVPGFAGSLSDRLRRRKPLALIGYALAAIAKPLIGLSTVWTGVLGARFLDRLGAGTRSAPRDALLAASADDAHRGRAFGLEGAGDNAGAFLGPVLTVILLAAWGLDLRWIFYLAIVPGFLALAMIFFVSEKRPAAGRAKVTFETDARALPRRYRAYLIATAVAGLGNSSNAFLILRTRELGVSLQATILIYAAFNLVAALVSYPAGALSDRIGRRNILLLGLAVFAVSYLGFALITNLILIGLLFVLYGAYQGIFRAVGKAFASDMVPEARRAGGIGWYSATVGLSGLVASAVAGLLWDHVGHAAAFAYGASLAALGGLALAMLVPAKGGGD
ncbi:MFS transporter [Sphingomonas oligophenolica]|uniref:MFS transporter n=1 Tax=Sphingomonas oligophenolica TaxID=301154 RepID=A0ABU9XZG0_9SPHN